MAFFSHIWSRSVLASDVQGTVLAVLLGTSVLLGSSVKAPPLLLHLGQDEMHAAWQVRSRILTALSDPTLRLVMRQ